MENISVVGLILILSNTVISYYGFKDSFFFDSYKFNVESILVDKEYKRLISSGFIHGSWTHLIVNMMSLYAFSEQLEYSIGPVKFLIIYFVSLLGGNLLSLFIHRYHGEYSAIGASGAVSGIIFSSIALIPGIEIGIVGLPVYIPGWLYAIAYVLFTIYGIKSAKDNIGHEAHLGGAMIGMLISVVFYPEALQYNYIPIMLVIIPSVVFIFLLVTKPYLLHIDSLSISGGNMTIDEKYNHAKTVKQEEVDRILDKINKKGYEKLTKSEKRFLHEFEQS